MIKSRQRCSVDEAVSNAQLALLASIQGLTGITVAPQVEVRRSGTTKSLSFTLTVPEQDLGKVIGRGGRTARALRILLTAMGKEVGQTWSLDVVTWPSSYSGSELHSQNDTQTSRLAQGKP